MSSEKFMIRAAVYLFLLKEKQLLLSRRYKTGWMDGKFGLVSGHLEANESIGQAMIREAKEEAGITIAPKDLKPATAIQRITPDQEYVDFFYVCEKWTGEPKIMEPNKCNEMGWFPINDLPNDLLPYIKEAFEKYQKGIPFFENIKR